MCLYLLTVFVADGSFRELQLKFVYTGTRTIFSIFICTQFGSSENIFEKTILIHQLLCFMNPFIFLADAMTY